MNRAFLSLYVVIVLSVVLVGWGTDKLWQVYNPTPQVEPFEELFFEFVESQFQDLSLEEARSQSEQLAAILGQDIQIYSLEELAKTSLAEQIARGGIVVVFDDRGRKSSYKRVVETDFILRVRLAQKNPEPGWFYLGLLVTFYLIIAVVIYFWIWPLARDLRKLQQQTQRVGVGGTPKPVELSQSSAIYSLAAAFNSMSKRIHELLASHREMTYAVSHELRTPLARMKFALEMARESPRRETVEKQLDSVGKDVGEMDKLINELLAYAGFEQHSRTLELKPGDLPSLVQAVVAANQQALEKPAVRVNILDGLNGNDVYCEWYLLERCLHNVIQNAFKHCNKRISITLSCPDNRYRIAVEDDGPGVEKPDRAKIFNAFVRLRNAGEENKSGFGLGLAIVHRIMKWHCGGVEVEASELGGAKFVLSWAAPNGDSLECASK